jgi:PHD/YefM family antitoxin component YafN of YafNO toxin-antitoxin module
MPTLTIKSDKPMVLIPVEEYDSLRETIEILSNPALIRDIKRGLKDIEEGRTVRLSELRRRKT